MNGGNNYTYGYISGCTNDRDRYEILLDTGELFDVTSGCSFEIQERNGQFLRVSAEYNERYYLMSENDLLEMPLRRTRIRMSRG